MTGPEPLLEVEDLAVHFTLRGRLPFARARVVRAVDGVSFRIERGETVGLVGESGSGKSTIGRAIVGLKRPAAGRIMFAGRDTTSLDRAALKRLRRRMQMIFQDPYSSLNPRMTVGEIVAEPLEIHGEGGARDRSNRVRELLDVVGLSAGAATRYPHQFSGGQQQRIGIARALALNPDLVVADEPVSALDVSIRAQIINLLRKLQARFGLAYLFIAHDLAVVRHISDRIMVMYLGRIVETASADDLYAAPRHPYTIALLSAVPLPDPRIEARRSRIILKGDVPSPADPPTGCAFHTRCWLRERLGRPTRCEDAVPPLREEANGHCVACHFPDRVADHLPSGARAISDRIKLL
ncbi:MAG: oligopeptide/dipeptide ABC transporter ATP-binding protein [Alphaproteobacteria bacterium]